MNLRILVPTLLGSVLLSAAAEASTLQNWRFDRNQNRLEIQTDIGVQPRAFLIFNPTRLVIDLPGVLLRRPKQSEDLDGAIRSLRIAQFERQTTRMVIELAPGYTLDPQKIKFRGVFANQWIVQLPEPEQTTEPVAAGATSPPTTVSAQTAVAVPLPEKLRPPLSVRPLPVRPPATLSGGRDPVQPARGQVVLVIDPGHGGPDPGAVGIGGLREVDVIMPVAFHLRELLQKQGIYVVMTREDDLDLGLEPRVQIAERANASLFVSIHANAISMARPDVNGVETFYFSSGKGLAQSIQRNIVQATGMRDRGAKRARFYVLQRTSMPAVLVEMGFVTGAEDAPRLRDSEFLKKMAEAIAQGILEYVRTGE